MRGEGWKAKIKLKREEKRGDRNFLERKNIEKTEKAKEKIKYNGPEKMDLPSHSQEYCQEFHFMI